MDSEERQVELTVGESFVVTLEGTASAGYEWTEHHDDTSLGLTRHESRPTGPDPGAGDVDEFEFQAIVPGEHTVEFRYQRPWESEPRRLISYNVTVT